MHDSFLFSQKKYLVSLIVYTDFTQGYDLRTAKD